MINLLLCCPSPRDIPEVQEAWAKLPYDRIEAKYYVERIAYQLLRKFFLEHKEYTHLAICPDDLVIKPEHVQKLLQELEKHDYPTIAGVCNVNLDDKIEYCAITHNLPHPTRPDPEKKRIGWRWYQWYKFDELPDHVFAVPFSGFACQIIRRDMVERYNFLDDAKPNGYDPKNQFTSSVDVMWANTAATENIPLMVDPSVRMRHLKKLGMIEVTISVYDGEMRFFKHKTQDSVAELSEGVKLSANVK